MASRCRGTAESADKLRRMITNIDRKRRTTTAMHVGEASRKATWERLWTQRKRVHIYRNVIEEAKRYLADLRNARVLEVGCGRGATLLELARCGANVVGLDYAESSISTCEALRSTVGLDGRADFVLGDARSLPFASESFDLVYSIGLLEHFEQPSVLLSEQHRVLRPGGFLLVQVPQKFSVYTMMKIPLTKLGRWPYGGWETQYSAAELGVLVHRAGFEAGAAFGYGSFALALVRHFFFPSLDYDAGARLWNFVPAIRGVRAYCALDVGVVARRNVAGTKAAS
jgi:2-polyprenyl-3-methyl-5-hydroxy-6-metoxy-1,4-benzoquinol methylase